MSKLSQEQLLDIYDEVFTLTHSDSFKCAEVNDLLFDADYYFFDQPKEGWYNSLKKYCDDNNIDMTEFNINQQIIN